MVNFSPSPMLNTTPNLLHRRQSLTLLTLLASAAWPALARADDPAALLRAGGCVVLLRHATTVPGIGDPPNFKLDDCRTQRNLSEVGQQESKRMSAWFTAQQLKPRAVLSSAWCRCKDTAQLAFGQHTVWPALNSTFSDRVNQPDQTAVVRQAMARIPAQQFEVWVTHQVNISSITQQGPAMGEGFILDHQGKVLSRMAFA